MIKLCIFADIHYIDKIPNLPVKRKLMEYADELTRNLIDKINNEIKPDMVICLGDMIQASNDINTDKENIKYILNLFKKINKPYYIVLGNHELKSVKNNKEILDLIGYKSATYSLDVDDYHFVFVGTDINAEDKVCRTQYISENDLEWLKNDLEVNKDKKIIVFSHFGIAEDTNIKENFWCYSEDGENLMLRNRTKLKELMENKNIVAVFCGHQHWTKNVEENRINYYMLGSLTENINEDGIPDGVYFEVEIEKDNINVIEKHLHIDKN